MRVLVITKDFPAPGQPVAGIFVLAQMQALQRLGHEILVTRVVPHAPAWSGKWRAYRAIPGRYEIEGIPVETIRAFFPPRMVAMEYLPLQVHSALSAIVSRFRPDIVHAHALIPSGQIAIRQGLPTVLTAHGSDAYDWPWRRAGLRRAAAEGVAGAAVVVAVSEFIRGHVRALFERDVDVIYNGADEALFGSLDRGRARGELGLDTNRRVIAFAGRPAASKGAFDLIDVTARLHDHNPVVLLAGLDASDRDVASAIASRGVDARLCGMLDRAGIARMHAAADVFCLPSYREGLPLAVCEAMLAGKPVVATTVGGIPEIVTSGVHGYLLAPGDRDGLERHLRTLLADPALVARMGARARDFALEHLTWQANARSYDALYKRALREAV
ncbi:MAG TPA: glycosyltransferase family 4 protein [Candidatus Baltobacteraceae bacterium]|jgi:teichuronic acid biosynthesis glycosyltransferase TuaC